MITFWLQQRKGDEGGIGAEIGSICEHTWKLAAGETGTCHTIFFTFMHSKYAQLVYYFNHKTDEALVKTKTWWNYAQIVSFRKPAVESSTCPGCGQIKVTLEETASLLSFSSSPGPGKGWLVLISTGTIQRHVHDQRHVLSSPTASESGCLCASSLCKWTWDFKITFCLASC